jgi:hypothetical protein
VTDVFGVSFPISGRRIDELRLQLQFLLTHQATSAKIEFKSLSQLPPADLVSELEKFKVWFDPTAKGARLRSVLARLETGTTIADLPSLIAVQLDDRRGLLTPEGYVVLWLISSASVRERFTPSPGQVSIANGALLDLYRGWSRRRIEDVVGLLGAETSTLRPAAAGLLFTLLMNRNTAPDRALVRPRNSDALERVSTAIGAPALAYASTLGGRNTSPTSVDLYRGWALGELRRRLGPGFHSNLDDGIWLEAATEASAESRLVEDVRRRDIGGRARVRSAVDAAATAYELQRPTLAALNLAFEQPGNTRRLRRLLEEAASPEEVD